jgi:hypothetical protein
MKALTIAEAWTAFEQIVLAADASPRHRRDAYLAFYSGALFVGRVLDTALELPQEVAFAWVGSIQTEMEAFEAVMRERTKEDTQ